MMTFNAFLSKSAKKGTLSFSHITKNCFSASSLSLGGLEATLAMLVMPLDSRRRNSETWEACYLLGLCCLLSRLFSVASGTVVIDPLPMSLPKVPVIPSSISWLSSRSMLKLVPLVAYMSCCWFVYASSFALNLLCIYSGSFFSSAIFLTFSLYSL